MIRLTILVCLVVGTWLPMPAEAAAQRQTVQVKEAALRSRSSGLSSATALLPFGTEVSVLEERGDWLRIVASEDRSGWLHRTALRGPRSPLRAGTRTVDRSATGDEVAMAGKGFDAQVEAVYRAEEPGIGFQWVDRMVGLKVNHGELDRFLREGGLGEARSGGRP